MASGKTAVHVEDQINKRSIIVEVLIRLVREKPMGAVGGAIVLIMFLTGIFADFIAPFGMNEVHPPDSLTPPSAGYILGTDILGRDVLSRIIFGARISMVVGLAGSGLNVVVATIIGVLSGYIGGNSISRCSVLSIPSCVFLRCFSTSRSCPSWGGAYYRLFWYWE